MYEKERQQICVTVKLMFDRMLTNIAGGNVSMRVSDEHVIMTPTLMSEEKHCVLKPEEVLVVDMNLNLIEGEGKITRESNMHMGIYKECPDVNAVIHSHPRESLVFASLGIPMPLVTEATEKFGEIITLPYAPACTQELADTAVSYFKTRKDELKKHGVAALIRKHGIILADKNLVKALDDLERIETNAYVVLRSQALK
jgi:Ribulose-5-phosphate 4-epimerase and related epimerases and aldolases